MRKFFTFFTLFLVLFLFCSMTCSVFIGSISENDFDVAEYSVDANSSEDLLISYGNDSYSRRNEGYRFNLYETERADNHSLTINLKMDKSKLKNNQHFRLWVKDDLKYERCLFTYFI